MTLELKLKMPIISDLNEIRIGVIRVDDGVLVTAVSQIRNPSARECGLRNSP